MLKIFSLKMKLIFISISLGVIPVLLIGGFSIMKFDSFAKETISKSYKELEEQAFTNIQSGVNAELEKIKPLISRTQRLAKRLAASPNIPLYLHAGSRAISTAKKEAAQIVKGLAETCKVQYKLVKDKVDLGLYTAEFIFQNKGGRVYFSSSTFIEWKCINQFTNHSTNVVLPQFNVGTEPIEKIYDYEDEFSPIVDDLQEMTGVNSSIFQKINDSGDMVRIATNVRNSDGTRAIETYIPAFNPDGKPNEVISQLMKGEVFQGIAYECNALYISIYKPLFNDSGTLLGAIFVGVPAKSMTLIDAVTKAKIGKLGYTYILSSKGDILIHPRPDLTGKNVLSDLGLSSFREVLEKKDENQVNLHFYTFEMQQKFISYVYFAPRDWIICVSGVLSDLQREEISRSKEVLKSEFINLYNSSKIKVSGDKENFILNQIRYLNLEGEEILSLRSGKFTEDLKFKSRSLWLKDAIKQKNGTVHNSGVVKSDNTGKVEMRVSSPVYENDKLNGITIMNMDWNIMGELLKTRVYGKTGYAFIIDENGMVVTHPKISIEDQINYSHERYGKLAKIVKERMLKGKKGHDRYSYRGLDYLIYYVPFNMGQKQYCLGATGPVNEFLSMANRIRKDAEREFGLILKIIIISICVCIILSSSIGIFVSKTISHPIDIVVNFARKVSEGDLSETLKTKKRDEIGHLLAAINTMVLAFRKIVNDLKLNGKRLAGSSDDMVTIARNLAGNSEKMSAQANMVSGTSEQMSDNINVIASRVEEMSVNVKNVSITTEKVSHNINSVAASIEDMSSSMTDIGSLAKMGSQIAGKAVIMAGKAGDTMSSLGKAANEIGGVTEVIKRLAYKTNLLALNASIEAASAGEAGKGFSVVASAIQNFAEQSNQAAEDIALRISGVQDSSSDAMSVIADVSKIIKDVNQSSETILNSVEEQTRVADEIASNAIQADSGAKAIAVSMGELSQGANDISQNITDVAMGANGVASSIREVSLAAADSNIGIRNVNTSAIELERLAGYLQALVEGFKMEESQVENTETNAGSEEII